MAFLFCNVGWMTHYRGQTSTDQIEGGGSYVAEEGSGFEVCNFLPHEGRVYGYVAPSGWRIRVARLGAGRNAGILTNATVVWTARKPQGKTVVVGWYKDATVYEDYQEFEPAPPCQARHGIDGYWIEARAEGAYVLPLDKRTIEIPRQTKGGMGQSNTWYADSPIGLAVIGQVDALMRSTP
jgi:hypothetical protein